MDSVPRKLNDYESMLAIGTCNIALRLSLSCPQTAVESLLCAAWARTVAAYAFPQCRLSTRQGDIGPLGQRYDIIPLEAPPADVVDIQFGTPASGKNLVRQLQQIGTTRLRIAKATYFVSCAVGNTDQVSDESTPQTPVTVIVSLSHAVSDGRGSLRIANTFIHNLAAELAEDPLKPNALTSPMPALDLQAAILGSAYGAGDPSNTAFYPQLASLRAAFKADAPALAGVPLLPREVAQGLPSDGAGDAAEAIDAVHAELTAGETERLLAACRARGASMQGAVTAAALIARLAMLRRPLPAAAPLLVPMDARVLGGALAEACLCGSAGLWVVTEVRDGDGLLATARAITASVRAASKARQAQEWLRRLFQDPAALPPHALMVSSVGVAPVEEVCGGVRVEELLFFGAEISSDAPKMKGRQATMLHAISFAARLQLMCNFTAPGVSQAFAEGSARIIKAALVEMAAVEDGKDVSVGSFLDRAGIGNS